MYFEERFNEKKKEDPLKDKITFTFRGIIPLPQLDENTVRAQITLSSSFRTKYKFHSAIWDLCLERNRLTISNNADGASIRAQLPPIWNGKCICSYNLYSDIEGRLLLYSSPRIEMINGRNSDTFTSPAGFMTKYDEAITENKLKKLVGYIELQLPTKYFYRPFEMPSCHLSKHLCDGYPTDMDNDFRFDFMRDSDFVIKCPGGEMRAMKIVLNNASEFMHEYFNTSNSNELTVEHSIDVIKPIIICFHTRCFEMPKVHDLDYARRLLIAKDFFKPDIRYRIETSVHQSLCQKFVEEKHTFDSVLQWLKIACHLRFRELETMINTVIADKFYYEWHETFPDGDARIEENPVFRDIFGQNSPRALSIFREINYNMVFSLLTNVIFD